MFLISRFIVLAYDAGDSHYASLAADGSSLPAIASLWWLVVYFIAALCCLSTDAFVPAPRIWRGILVTGLFAFEAQTLVRLLFFGGQWSSSSSSSPSYAPRAMCVWHSCTTTALLRVEAAAALCAISLKHALTLVAAPTAACALRASVGARRVRVAHAEAEAESTAP